MFSTSTMLPRHAFSARDAARAGDVWRLFQEVAVEGSTACGWPPMRYREEKTAFVVRSMTVRHHLEATYGEPLAATTWVSRMRREMLSTREIRVRSSRGAIASARQEWVYVSESLEMARAPRSLLDAFPVESGPDDDAAPELPALAREVDAHEPHVFTFRAWWTWMDPLDHVNHPQYVDFCDEALSIAARAAGLAPRDVEPIAEELTFRSPVAAGDEVRVETTARGHTEDGAAVFATRILVGDRVCVTGTTVRRMLGETGPSRLVDAIRTSR
ncbi:hotdog domain-containing protein [Sandaracinus amylolyticus]|uniref:hotdog domain-containing protein n=1 Tax=Sandaracinus amylolyticus TaxID=927083 RepID=UPI001F1E9052|nr:hotdog domain-containing protein [Sandaracinus amylolyticus]UJR78244.1 Acyl-CoA thioesterase [Sandaracinus amylolyticus]